MHKFFLAYEIDHSGAYIVPERLPAVAPKYEWDSRDNLRLHYRYDFFMPKGILSQFIVQMHRRYIRNHDLVWRRGVILEREQTRAEITESYDARTIKIRLAGQHCRDFFTIIAEQFDQINGQYEKMQVDKLIPCNYADCKTAETPYFYEYKKLQRRLEKGQQDVQCEESYQMVNVRSLIDDVMNAAPHHAGTNRREAWEDKDENQLANEKLKRLRESYFTETDQARKFQIDQQIQELYADSQKLGIELDGGNAGKR